MLKALQGWRAPTTNFRPADIPAPVHRPWVLTPTATVEIILFPMTASLGGLLGHREEAGFVTLIGIAGCGGRAVS